MPSSGMVPRDLQIPKIENKSVASFINPKPLEGEVRFSNAHVTFHVEKTRMRLLDIKQTRRELALTPSSPSLAGRSHHVESLVVGSGSSHAGFCDEENENRVHVLLDGNWLQNFHHLLSSEPKNWELSASNFQQILNKEFNAFLCLTV